MSAVQDMFTEYGPVYIERFGDNMPAVHKRVINDIISCRTESCGMTVYDCPDCGTVHHFYRSCGSRHCPVCQRRKAPEWTEKQLKRVLPGHHFMVTFTVPQQLRDFMRSHQKAGYGALSAASSDSLKKLSRDKKFVGGDLSGFFGVLHTWDRTVLYHPHVHYAVPGGALSSGDGLWHPSRSDFCLPVRALSKIYKARFRDLMKKEGLYDRIPPEVWDIDWNVNAQAVGNAENTVRHLSRYVFQAAISDCRIVKHGEGKVTFKHRKKGSSRDRHMTLGVTEFMRRFLQHVLPPGFMKVRYCGFLNPNSGTDLNEVRTLIEMCYEFEIQTPEYELRPPEPLHCPHCGGVLKYRCSVLPHEMIPFRDTG